MLNVIEQLSRQNAALPLSWSRMQTLFSCPRLFHLRYRKKEKSTETLEDKYSAETGKIMHKIMELCMRDCSVLGPSMENARYDRTFESVVNNYPEVSEESRRRARLVRDSAKYVLEQLIEGMTTKSRIFVESKLVLNRLWRPQKYLSWADTAFVGYIDLEVVTAPDAMLVDYKTEPFTFERAEQTDRQLGLYAYVEMMRHPFLNRVETVSAFLQDSRLHKGTVWHREQLPEIGENFRQQCLRYLEALQLSPEPVVGKQCAWCPYSYNCKAKGLVKTWQPREDKEEGAQHPEKATAL